MRILVNHYSPDPNVVTGITAYTWSIISSLAGLPGADVLLCTNWDKDHLPKAFSDSGIDARHLATHRNEAAAVIGRALSLPIIERYFAADVIFTPLYYQIPFSRAARVTVVHDLYNLTNPSWYGPGRHRQWALIFPQSIRRSDMMLCVSGATRDDLVRFYPHAADKTAVVHEASALAANAKVSETNPLHEPYCLMVANVEPNKNVSQALEAAHLLAKKGRSIRFVLVGRDRSGLLDRFRADAPNVKLTQIQGASDEELVTLYRHANCFVNTSLAEGFCLPILEAQGQGTPVICSDIPVLHEVAGAGAVFVDPHDPGALAGAIAHMFDDSLFASKVTQLGSRNFERFSWKRAAVETLEVFEQAIERRSAIAGSRRLQRA